MWPRYLQNIVSRYFKDRRLRIDRDELEVWAGIPQGSILGPTLWNLYYDPVLQLEVPEGVELIGFADDLALVACAEDARELMHRVDWALDMIGECMRKYKLRLAPHKSEAVVLKGPRKRDNIVFTLDGIPIVPTGSVRYLGVVIDKNLSFGPHILKVVQKAKERMSGLTRVMPNIGGPSSKKREILAGVVHSIVLYAAPVWHRVMAVQRYRGMLERVQRQALLRVASAYRTVSVRALQVITGSVPITLLAQERNRLFGREGGCLPEHRREERIRTLEEWQALWEENTEVAQWTKSLIPDLRAWVKCKHRRLNYFLTQALTGHGSYGTYLKRMGKQPDENCFYCGEQDTAEHTLFRCDRWSRQRSEARLDTGREITVGDLVTVMLESKRHYDIINKMVTGIMSTKEREERERQGVR